MVAKSVRKCFCSHPNDATQDLSANQPSQPTIKIGVVLPLSGKNDHIGERTFAAATLAFDEATKNSKYNYEMIVDDDQLRRVLTTDIVETMCSVDKVDAFVTCFSEAAFVGRTFSEKYQVMHFAASWEDRIADGKYNFAQNAKREDMIAKILEQIKFWPDAKNVAILSDFVPGVGVLSHSLQVDLETAGYNVSLDMIHKEEKDFRPLIQKLKNQETDLFILCLLPPALDTIVTQLHEAGITNSNIFGTNFEPSQNLAALEGARFISNSAPAEEFARKMDGKVSVLSVTVYDLVRLIIRAYEANYQDGEEKPSNEMIAKYILSLEPYDCAAVKSTVTPQGFISTPATVMTVKDGKVIVYDELLAKAI